MNTTVRQSDSGSQWGIMGNTLLIRVIINRLLKSLQEKLVRLQTEHCNSILSKWRVQIINQRRLEMRKTIGIVK